eukprot:2641215-Pyramimonas_sp.AAC.1
MAGASLWPRWRAQARAHSDQMVWHNRCDRDGAYRMQRPSACQRPRQRARASMRVGGSGGRSIMMKPTTPARMMKMIVAMVL